jgi:hypothetical protein
LERVKKIKADNLKNIVPQELEAVEVTSNKPKEVEPEFVDVVGQISLRSLEKAEKRKRGNQGPQQQQQRRRDTRPPQNNNNKKGGGKR